ncbi:MAG: hypothetical protein JW997_04165 [Actinobacteria bacterium]|nr:hypothetical protein [Actinomycetota bacterium]
MNTRLAEEQVFNRKAYPLLYLVKKQEEQGTEKIIQSHSGMFYIMAIIVVFFSLALLLNIGLKIQSVNYERNIISLNEMILLEQERSDRALLKISELKNPARVIEEAEKKLDMKIADEIKIMQIQGYGAYSAESIENYIADKSSSEIKIYDNFITAIYNIRDIIMVVSEGVLTFFIP